MSIFNKKEKGSKNPPIEKYSGSKYYKTTPENKKIIIKKEEKPSKNTKIVKKKKIGLRSYKKAQEQKQNKIEKNNEDLKVSDEQYIEPGDNLSEISTEFSEEEKNDEALNTKKKKKKIFKKDMKGKPVYLEDTGEKLGTVHDNILDKKNNLVGFKIKDKKSNTILSFSIDQFDENKEGLIFIPGWYTNALKIIEKLEFKDKISPELTALITDDAVSNKELYNIFIKHDNEMVDYIDDAISLKEVLYNRLKILEKQRLNLKDDLMDLTEKRLIKDIDRREFSQDVMEHRRKVNIIDVNINKCKDLIKRLENTSFGMLGKDRAFNEISAIKKEKNSIDTNSVNSKDRDIILNEDVQVPYKEKYFALKEQFNQLEEEYQELKLSVEKLFNENEL